jgi:hypothetical protein
LQPGVWAILQADTQKKSLPGNPMQSPDYFGLARVFLAPGKAYTLSAEWDDGGPMLLLVQGHDPAIDAPAPPSGSARFAAINTSGGQAYRINFRVDPRSPGSLAHIVFAAGKPGRKARILLSDPAEPDAAVTALTGGKSTGGLI